jgi:hypothetical protein
MSKPLSLERILTPELLRDSNSFIGHGCAVTLPNGSAVVIICINKEDAAGVCEYLTDRVMDYDLIPEVLITSPPWASRRITR